MSEKEKRERLLVAGENEIFGHGIVRNEDVPVIHISADDVPGYINWPLARVILCAAIFCACFAYLAAS